MDTAVLRRYMARLAEQGVKLPMLIGISPLRSAKSARWMREKLFGTIIPDAIVERLEAAADPAAEGRRICVDLMQEMAKIPGVAGVHIMAPGNEAGIADVIRDAAQVMPPLSVTTARPSPGPARTARGAAARRWRRTPRWRSPPQPGGSTARRRRWPAGRAG